MINMRQTKQRRLYTPNRACFIRNRFHDITIVVLLFIHIDSSVRTLRLCVLCANNSLFHRTIACSAILMLFSRCPKGMHRRIIRFQGVCGRAFTTYQERIFSFIGKCSRPHCCTIILLSQLQKQFL